MKHALGLTTLALALSLIGPSACNKTTTPSAAGKVPEQNAEAQKQAQPLAPGSTGRVNVYNWLDYIAENTNVDFAEATGVVVKYGTFYSTEELEAKLLGGNSGYDVVAPSGAFLGNQIQAGLFHKLDKSKLPNLANLDPVLLKATEVFDPGHDYSLPYLWGTVGIGYNLAKIKQRMPEAPLDSWDLVFNPSVVSKFKDCGVTMLDAPSEIMQSVLLYLGKDPHSDKAEDYAEVRNVLLTIRPYIKYFHSSSYLVDMARGRICLAIGWNGDFAIAQGRADDANSGVELRYSIPKEGALIWVDNLAIPSDAKNVDNALIYINYLMDPQVAANNANFVRYATPNKMALDTGLITAEDRNNPAIYPPVAVKAKLAADKPASAELEQLRERIWRDIKASQ